MAGYIKLYHRDTTLEKAEAMVRALARWDQVAVHPNLEAWVVRTAVNVYRSWWRRWKHHCSATACYPAPGISIAAFARPLMTLRVRCMDDLIGE